MDRIWHWPILALETIGRVTYKSIFWFINNIFRLSGIFVDVFKTNLNQLQSLKLPSVKLPRIKLPRKRRRKKIKFSFILPSLPKISLPKVRLPKWPRRRKTKLKLIKPQLRPWQYFILSLITALALVFYWFILKDLPKPSDLTKRLPTLSTKIYDRNQNLLFTFYKDQNRTLMNLSDIPDHFIKATLAIEDNQFYQHSGFSYKGILRSLNQIVFKRSLQGGSTITQQLVKTALLTPERTIIRKTKELILAIGVELLYSKDEILEMYLNQVSYGGTAYGAEQAAQTYFGKSIKQVNLAQAALLAGLPASPTTYSPFGANPYLSVYRQHQVLNLMVENQFIAPQEATLSKKQKITLAPQYQNIKAPHFVMFVKKLLVEEYGENVVEQGGLTVITSLDLDLQNQAQAIVTEEINSLFPLKITNGAALVTKPKTGEILAMVGSRDYFDTERDGQVNVTNRLRQPGSSIKPVNYAYALENGYTAGSVINDSPITYNLAGTKPYSPVNYDSSWHGNITLRTALANSYNVPAVKVLASYGVDKMIEQGAKMGITTWNQPERYGLSLTLGGAEVTMIDMAVVYATLANQGLKVDLHPILKVTDPQNRILQDFSCEDIPKISLPEPAEAAAKHLTCKPEPVLNSYTAYILNDILSDTVSRIPAFGSRSFLNIPGHQVAVKTGTTNDKRDNWTIGYTKDYLTAVWVGNNDNSPMSQVASGITGASPIWHKIMLVLLEDKPEHKFDVPSDLIKVNICTLTGQLACQGCPTKQEYFVPGTEPKQACSSEYIKQLIEQKQKEQEERDKIPTGESTP